MTRDELKIRIKQAIDYIPTFMERDDGWSQIESILYEILIEFDDKDSNWHTGTPTEEGWYQIAIRFGNRIEYDSRKCKRIIDNNGNECMRFDGCNPVLAWQKIEPYKEKENSVGLE